MDRLEGWKKITVFISAVAVAAAVTFFDVEEEKAKQFMDWLTPLVLGYLGGQGVADAGRYFGKAMNGHKPAVLETPGDGD